MKLVHSMFLGLLAVACGGEPSESGQLSLRMALVGDDGDSSDEGALDAAEAGGAVLRVESALVAVRRIELQLPEGEACDAPSFDDESGGDDDERRGVRCEDDELVVDGPWIVDLVSGRSTPDLGEVSAPAGVYRRIDVRLQKVDSGGELEVPGELSELTLVASGRYEGELAERFELALDFTEDARFESEAGIELAPGSLRRALLGLAPRRWFQGLSIASCLERGELSVSGGSVRIDEGSGGCSELENTIKDAIKDSGRLR